MARDYNLLLDTTASPDEVRGSLVSHCGFSQDLGEGWITNGAVDAIVSSARDWAVHLADPGIPAVTVLVGFTPDMDRDNSIDQVYRHAAALMRRYPGDAALTAEDARTAILRLGDAVYLDPRQARADRVSAEDFAPMRVVVGIPEGAPQP